ncbi:MAG: ribulokinase [Coriobacteriia bacterium]|nr:ribulokinase [Coriobacteriia bacterium]
MTTKKVIGIDYGTLSARAVALDVETGALCGSSTYVYPHGVMEDGYPDNYALAHPQDYKDALVNIIKGCNCKPDEVIGIGLDATTYTLVPCDAQGNAMCEHDKYAHEPMAYIKLWKHHAAQDQADRIQAAHDKTGGFPAIERYGGKVNCEWALPKLLETYELAPELWQDTYRFCDLGEWITRMLTGKFTSSLYSLGFKCMWTPEYGKPTKEGLDCLSEGFADELDKKFWGEPISHFKACGTLTTEMANTLGLNPDIPVAAAMGDGSIPGIYFCINEPGALALTYGTSIAMSFVNDKLHAATGINGVVKDGIVEGCYSYDAGQPCAGDMLDWFVTYSVPEIYSDPDPHTCLTNFCLQKNPWENKLTVLDWWNGNRGILNDLSLRGSIIGYSLDTRPEDIYCAMLQGIACGNKRIIDHLEENGIHFDKIIVCGGIAKKNKFAMQQYANIVGREIYISDATDITARSSAMLGASAAGMDISSVVKNMTNDNYDVIKPDFDHKAEYAKIYSRWCRFHDLLSKE